MDDFQQDFMRKVHNPTVEGEVVGASNRFGDPKKPLDKRWFIVGGLILVLVIVFVVLLIISNSKSGTQSQGDPITEEKITTITWTCDDNSTLVFDTDKNVTWTDKVGTMRDTYSISGNSMTFGGVTGTIKDDTLTLVTTGLDRTIICKKENK